MADYVETCFKEFVSGILTVVTEHYENDFPTLSVPEIGVDYGRKYWRVWKDGGQKSVYGFVRKEDGAIFKAATWKAPQTKTKTASRGSVTDEFPLDYVTAYGVKYA